MREAVAKVAIAQTPAIVLYLGETLDLLPATPTLRALTLKIVCDANDVIDEMTNDGGREMWTDKRWAAFVPRLKKWMSFWEETGRRHGLTADAGFLLGGETPGVADVVTATLWSTLTERFASIGELLDEAAPMTAALVRRVAQLPPLRALADKARSLARPRAAARVADEIEARARTLGARRAAARVSAITSDRRTRASVGMVVWYACWPFS